MSWKVNLIFPLRISLDQYQCYYINENVKVLIVLNTYLKKKDKKKIYLCLTSILFYFIRAQKIIVKLAFYLIEHIFHHVEKKQNAKISGYY